ncbi:MAG: coproporphyrinogen III oxidase [Bacteroidota bacterium]
MKKLILSLAFAGSIMIAASACNSTKNVSDTTDSTAVDTAMVPIDTTKVVPVDTTTVPPDTTVKPVQ